MQASVKYGDILDIPFPIVPPSFDENAVQTLADECVNRILSVLTGNDAVLAQGEFTLCYAVVYRLRAENIRVVSACTERVTEESVKPDGEVEKVSRFRFVRYRDYS